ncbi:MAG: Asp23/Gls24 family envelope stress response protein [Mycobacteriales bacterium]
MLAPPADRGHLTVAPAVVEGIATTAAGEVEGVAAGGRRASATVLGSTAALRIGVGLDYPAPIPARIDAIRGRVIERVGELAGLSVERVDVDVVALHTDASDRVR